MNEPRHPPIPPPDAMLGDRLVALARAAWLAARTPVLWARGLGRRAASPPAPTLVSRILAVRTDRIGDMALTSAAFADLKAHFTHARITVLAPAAPLALLEHHPAVDRLVPLAGHRLPEELSGRFDLAIDFTPDERLLGARLVGASRAPWRLGFARAGREIHFTLHGPDALPARHLVDMHRELLAAAGVVAPASEPALVVAAPERAAALARLAALGAAAPRVLVHPGAHEQTQRWAPERFAETIARLTERAGAACLVASGPGEEGLASHIAGLTPDALSLGTLTVRELMAVTSACELFIGNNSGPLHVAAALGIPTVSVMGPTDPRRFWPRGAAPKVLRLELPCSPCNRGRCWHHTCLQGIEADEVIAAALEILDAQVARAA
jgi:lipopolysaccharide heptosyltransferase II